MDVTLPNGQVINNVPEGTSKADLVAKLKANGHDTSWYKPEISPEAQKELSRRAAEATLADMPWHQRALVGAGKAVADVGRTFGLMDKGGSEEADAALTNDTAGMLGNIGGEIAMTALPGAAGYRAANAAARALPYASRIAANRFGAAAIGGAGAGAAANATVGKDIGEGAALGAAMGPAGTVIGDVGGWAASRVPRLFERADQLAVRRLREFSQNPELDAATLRGLRGAVPGETPTSGMAAVVDPNMQYMKELEEQARRRISGQFITRDAQNQAAREAILEPGATSVTRYPGEQLSEAEALRRRVTQPLYARAEPDRIVLNPELEQRIAMSEANRAVTSGERTFAQGQANAASAGRPVPEGFAPAQTQPVMRDASTGATMAEAGPFMPQPATRSIEELQKIRFELDRQLNTLANSTDAAGKARFAELQDFRNQISNEMRGQSGNFATADTIFRNYSQPVNQGNIDRVLLEALRSPTGKANPETFAAAWQNAPRTINRADIPVGRGEHIEEFVTPEHMAQLRALRGSVQNQAEYNRIPRMELPGIESAADEVSGVTPVYVNKALTITKNILRRMGVSTDEDAMRVIDEAVADPNRMAALLERVPPGDRIPLLSAIRERNPKGATIGLTSGAVSEKRNKDAPQ
jgi:hypothetical protein